MQAVRINPEKNFPLEIVLKSQEMQDFQIGKPGSTLISLWNP